MSRRWIAGLLATAMVVTMLLPVSAFAEELSTVDSTVVGGLSEQETDGSDVTAEQPAEEGFGTDEEASGQENSDETADMAKNAGTEEAIATLAGDFNIGNSNASLTVSGGTFDRELDEKYLADGFEMKQNEDGTFTTIESMAGEGTASNPYIISNLDQLKLFRDKVNDGEDTAGKFYKLAADIDLAGEEWMPIGTNGHRFQGNFDGDGHKITNLKIDNEDLQYAGLFGIMQSATIEGLTVENVDITAKSEAGGLIGSAFTGSISNCHVTGNVTITANYKVGGLAGEGYAAISDCTVKTNAGSTVTGNYTNKATNLEGDNVGGLVGYRGEGSTITTNDCQVQGLTVSGTRKVGGIIGSAFTSNKIQGCVVSDVTVYSNAEQDYVDNNTSSIGIGGIVGLYSTEPNGPVNGIISGCTVNNVTLNSKESNVFRGYLTAGMRGSLPGLPQGSWTQTNNKVTGQCTGGNVPGVAVNDVYFSDFSKAVEEMQQSGGSIRLLGNVNTNQKVSFTTDKDITLELGGYSLEYTGTGTYAVELSGGVSLTVTDSVGSGTITAPKRVIKVGGGTIRTSGTPASLVLNGGKLCSLDKNENCAVAIYANSSAERGENSKVDCVVTVNKATLEGGVYLFGEGARLDVNEGAVIEVTGYYGISGNGSKTTTQNNGGTVINITGGTITQSGVGGAAIYHPQDGKLDISGNPVIKGDSGIQLCSGEGVIAQITGGTIEATGTDQREGKTGDGLIPDGAALSIVNRNYPGGIPHMTVSGGVFKAASNNGVLAYTWSNNKAEEWPEATQYFTITGGSFSNDPSAYIASGYRVTGNNPYVVSKIPVTPPQGPQDDDDDDTSAPVATPTPVATPVPTATARPTTVVSHSKPTATPAATAQVPTGDPVVAATQVEATVAENTAVVTVDSKQLTNTVNQVISEAKASDGAPVVKVEVAGAAEATAIEVTLPVQALDTLAKEPGATLTVTSDVAEVTFDTTALTSIAGQADEEIVLVVTPVAQEDMSDAQAEKVNGYPTFELTLQSGGKIISDFNRGEATVTLPYALAEGQQAEGVVVWYVEDNGNTTVCETAYDSQAQKVTFVTPHFSRYAIAYDETLVADQTGAELPVAQEPATQEPAQEGGISLPMVIGIAVIVILVMVFAGRIFFAKKDSDRY